jgi:DNA phosphorothioation-associated putative methyltransferase
VNIGFVINVIEDFEERVEALRRAYELTGQAMSVAAMLLAGSDQPGRPYRDGYLSSRNTFQKYYSQAELAGFVAEVLEEEPVPVSPGVFLVFRDKSLEQQFLASRDRNVGFVNRLIRIERQRVAERGPRQDRDEAKYQEHAQDLEALWECWLSLGRIPEDDEVPNAPNLAVAFGSVRRAVRFLERHKDLQLLERARATRRDDLLVYFALQQFRHRPRYRQLETRLQRDIKAFFGDYGTAQAQALQLLLTAREPEQLHQACVAAAEQGLGWMDEDSSLQLQTTLVERLSPLLRVYVGCAALLYGDVRSADLLKVHIRSGKLSLMRFDNFVENPLPRMIERVKVNMRTQEVDVFRYQDGFEPPYLYRKSRFLDEESVMYADQIAFEEQLDQAGMLDFSGYGPSTTEFDQQLKRRRLAIDGYRLVPCKSIPDLDELCGENLTFRQLIECGETQRRTGHPNVPKEPETYNALYELASKILDPVIEYYGSIELTYGFASQELTKSIPSRIAPKIDQHASHERNKRGVHICSRLGAAVDFLVRDEDMFEVAQWIAANLPFDRLYFYGPDRPVHVSYGPDQSRSFVEMRESGTSRRIPYVRRS